MTTKRREEPILPHHRYLFLTLMILLTFAAFRPVNAAPGQLPGQAPVGERLLHPARQTTFRCSAVTTIPLSECQALATFYLDTDGLNWVESSGWLVDPHPCQWYGITCAGGRITGILLPDNGLAGQLPAALGNLRALRVLDLAENPAPLSAQAQATTIQATETDAQLTALRERTDALLAETSVAHQQELLARQTISLTLAAARAGDSFSPLVNLDDEALRSPVYQSADEELRSFATQRAKTGLVTTSTNGPSASRAVSVVAQNSARQQWLAALPVLTATERAQLSAALNTTGVNQLQGPLPAAIGELTNLLYLDLSGNAFSGPLPATWGNLGNLTMLDLTGHQLSGTLPAAWGNLTRLQRLELAGALDPLGNKLSQLGGSIPSEVGNLSGLLVLDLSYNWLSGPIPSTLGQLSQLQSLNLFWNILEGDIPSSMGNLANLTLLDLGANPLGGSIPASLFQLTNLEILGLSGNGLYGTIAPEFGTLTKLQTLLLSYNQFDGTIPTALSNLSNLTWLDLSNNALTGTIPPALANVQTLHWLDLQDNQLSGPFPTALTTLPQLLRLNLSNNGFNGSLPTDWGQLTTLQELRLSNNGFSGPLPASIGDLTNLIRLYLDGNQLSGTLPTALGKLTALQTLWLANNDLTGPLPVEVTTLPSLQFLALINNGLSGPLPIQWGGQETMLAVGLSSNRFSGPLPPALGTLHQLIILDLQNNRLSGPIPAELWKLQSLQSLGLTNNLFSGPLAPEVGQLTMLRSLGLAVNNLSGPLPATLADLTQLQQLHLFTNEFTGPIPNGLGALTQLQELSLSENHLTGTLPADWDTLGELTTLQLSENRLTGAIPANLGNLTKLQMLRLDNNRLTGEIPATLGNLSQLSDLMLASNRLEGEIPETFGNLQQMQNLNLSINRLQGTIPASLANLTELTDLWLAQNALQGTIPPTLSALTKLTILSLSDNHLQGELPPALGDLTELRWLYLGANALSGPLPPELGKLTKLRRLYLTFNQLSGPVPAELANLQELNSLELGSNQLSGEIPPDLGKLRNLHTLELARNHLRGPLPPEIGKLTYLAVLTLHGNRLSGELPTTLGNLPYLQQLWLHSNAFSGAVPPHIGNLARLSTLRLNANALQGPLPTQLTLLSRLAELTLEQNQLTATEAALLTFLSEKAPGWQASQTVPPTDLKVNVAALDTLALAWTPIAYRGDSGYYEVSYATAADGPFTVHGKTTDKAVPGYTVTGLASGVTYYFRVRTYTPPRGTQENELWSDYTPLVMGTTPSDRAPGDSHEADESCDQARTIVADGYTQRHTFHTAADVDWVHFTARPTVPYRIEVQIPTLSAVDIRVELFDFCEGSSPIATWDEPFSPGARLDFTPTVAGAYFVRLTDSAQPDATGTRDESTSAYDLKVRTLDSEARTDAVILVAGKLRNNDSLQSNIHNVLNNAYQLFRDNGYSDDQITFLATDKTLPGYDDAATVANLQQAVTLWAKNRVTSDHALTLYLMDHGEAGELFLDKPAGEILHPADLDQWLATLEEAVPGIQINVIIEACYAGSFITGNSASLSRDGRVVLTSTTHELRAYASTIGAYFSDSFLTALREGNHLFGSFEQARRDLIQNGDYQQAWLDANGNGIPNEIGDAAIAARRTLVTNGNGQATNWRPYIQSAHLDTNDEANSATISAVVTDNKAVARVWAVIYPPNYQPPQNSNELQPEDQPTIELILQDGLYRGDYNGLTERGRYSVILHATDNDGLQATPVVLKSDYQRAFGESSYQLYLPVVQLRAGNQ